MATSLKQVQESMGTLPIKEKEEDLGSSFIEDYGSGTEPSQPETAEQKYIVFRLVKKKVRRLTLDGICHEVMNPNTKIPETIRLIRGASSIWTTELTELLKDKEYVSKNRIGLHFEDGICRVGIHELNKIEFARRNKNNVGKNRSGSGKYDYYEYDAAEEQKMRHEKQMGRINLIQSISTMDEKKMIKLALFLGIKPYDDEVGLPKTPDGYRTELLIKADTQPEIVNRYLNAKEVEIAYLVRKAITEAKIDLGGQTGNVIWAGGGGHIAKIPSHRKPLEYLTELAMTNSQEGKQFKEQLESMIT